MGKALHNIVHAHPEQKQCKREAKILRLLEVLRMYSDFLKDMQISGEVTKGCGQVRLGVAMTPNQQEILTCSKYLLFGVFFSKKRVLNSIHSVNSSARGSCFHKLTTDVSSC